MWGLALVPGFLGVAQMVRHNRNAIRGALCTAITVAALWSCTGAKAAVGPSLCVRLMAKMHRSPDIVIEDAASPSPTWLPWIAYAPSNAPVSSNDYRRIASAWRTRMGPMTMQGIQTLRRTDLFMPYGYVGAYSCMAYMFVTSKPDGALQIVRFPPGLPVDMSSPCELTNESAGLAMVLGQPTYIESTRTGGDHRGSVLSVLPWLGTAWGTPCQVSIRPTYRYPVALRYCGSDRALCRAARQVAPRVARLQHVYSTEWLDAFNQRLPLPKFRFDGTLSAQGHALVDRAQRIAKSVVKSRGAPARDRNAILMDFNFFPLELGHRFYLGAATNGVDPADTARWFVPSDRYIGHTGSQPEPGTLFLVYQAPGAHSHQFVPLAVFSMHQEISGVRLIQVRDVRR